MVATDVASRGIGEYLHHPLPSPSPWQLPATTCCALLSCLGALFIAQYCLVSSCLFGSQMCGVLVRSVAAHLLCSLVCPCAALPAHGTSVDLTLFDRVKWSPPRFLPPEDPGALKLP